MENNKKSFKEMLYEQMKKLNICYTPRREPLTDEQWDNLNRENRRKAKNRKKVVTNRNNQENI